MREMADDENGNSNDKPPDLVTLNLRGVNFEIDKSTLLKLPPISPFTGSIRKNNNKTDANATLTEILSDRDAKDVIYVNSNPEFFHYILDYLLYDSLHFPDSICTDVVHRELSFWGLEDSRTLAACCYDRVLKELDSAQTTSKLTKLWRRMTFKQRFKAGSETQDRKLSVGRIREKLWNFLERPNSSVFAKVWMAFTILVIIISVSTLMLETLPSLREPEFNITAIKMESNLTLGQGVYRYYIMHSKPQQWILITDAVCTAFLSLEFILRFMVAVKKCRYLLKPLNIADLLGLLPMWAHFALMMLGLVTNYKTKQMQIVTDSLTFFKLCRTLRFGRIMMLNKQLRIVILALVHSWQELLIMVSITLVSATVFGSLIYYIELPDDIFLTVFHGMWWSIVTMTTVGYGDFYPKSAAGYFIGVICSVCGIVVIAIATTVIVNHFLIAHAAVEIYERSKRNTAGNDTEEDEEFINIDNSKSKVAKINGNEMKNKIDVNGGAYCNPALPELGDEADDYDVTQSIDSRRQSKNLAVVVEQGQSSSTV